MNTVVRKEVEEMIVSGRRKTEEEFDRILDEYLQGKTKQDKGEINEALADFFADRIRQFVEVENKLAKLRQTNGVEKSVNIFEMAS